MRAQADVIVIHSAPAILAGTVLPLGPNGKHQELFGTPHVYRREPGDSATDTDDDPGSGEGRPLCRRPHGAGPVPACEPSRDPHGC
jgi:hypothetical protein